MGTEALPRISPAPLPYFQLLSQTAKFRKHRILCSLRIRIGTSSTAARTLCVRIRCDARARAPAGKRARAWHARTSHAIPEARRRAEAGLTRGRPVLAGSLLRFQRLERAQVRGKAPLHTPQSREAWVGRAARGLDLEQLPPLPERSSRSGGDRVAVDGAEERTRRDISYSSGASPAENPRPSAAWTGHPRE